MRQFRQALLLREGIAACTEQANDALTLPGVSGIHRVGGGGAAEAEMVSSLSEIAPKR